ncbi:J domain-containing protein [Agromyces sp. NPDC056523]|uniref:J domain-containing protein n=1 Tax=Agromyces sp. NPDC056523 TaxID=3345850 RepID=UPI0036716D3A
MARASDLTPDEAASVLGVPRDAELPEVERAYRRLARELHPDRYAGRPVDEAAAAAARFVQVARAHEVLLAAAADRAATSDRSVAEPVPAEGFSRPPRPLPRFSWWLFGTWALILVIGALLSTATGPILTPLDVWGRLGLLVAFALATALTRRRWVWWTTLALLLLSGVAVIASTTVIGLLGLGFMAVASVGLAVQAGLVRFPEQ